MLGKIVHNLEKKQQLYFCVPHQHCTVCLWRVTWHQTDCNAHVSHSKVLCHKAPSGVPTSMIHFMHSDKKNISQCSGSKIIFLAMPFFFLPKPNAIVSTILVLQNNTDWPERCSHVSMELYGHRAYTTHYR